MAVLEKFNG